MESEHGEQSNEQCVGLHFKEFGQTDCARDGCSPFQNASVPCRLDIATCINMADCNDLDVRTATYRAVCANALKIV